MLSALEDRGFRFHLDGDHLTVQAPDELLDDDVLDELRQNKATLMAEYRLRVFVRLVQAFGTSHGLLLDDHVVLAELDDDDREELLTSDIEDRQRWAELLAYRLTRSTHQ